MSITTRPVAEGDFFAWLGLYEGYASFYETTLADEKAVLIWSWLVDPKHAENGLLAIDDDGTVVGLVHFREFPRPLEGDRGLFIDDLFVADGARDQGAGTALIEAVRRIAEERKYGVVQWITADDNDTAKKLYEELGSRTPWVTYEIAL